MLPLGTLEMILALWLGTAVYFSYHASQNGKTKLWGVAVLVSGLIGMVAYAISLASDD